METRKQEYFDFLKDKGENRKQPDYLVQFPKEMHKMLSIFEQLTSGDNRKLFTGVYKYMDTLVSQLLNQEAPRNIYFDRYIDILMDKYIF